MVIVSEISVSGSETYLVVIAYTKLSLCLTFSLVLGVSAFDSQASVDRECPTCLQRHQSNIF